MATTREKIYRAFGPLLIEALVKLIFKQINILRVRAGLNELTVQQAMDALEDEHVSLSKYNWME